MVGFGTSLQHLPGLGLVLFADVVVALLVDGDDVVAALREEDSHG